MTHLYQSVVGCDTGDVYLNVLDYANDIPLLAPVADAMKNILRRWNESATEFSIDFNDKKSNYVIFNCRGSNKSIDPLMLLLYVNAL